MKKLWASAFLVLLVFACTPKVYIATPEIAIDNNTALVFDEITIQIEDQVDVDGTIFEIENYNWSIEDLDGVVIRNGFPDTAVISWTPLTYGVFIIRADISYNGSERIVSYKEIHVSESIASLQYQLTGEWVGHAKWSIGEEWDLEIKFDSSGFCSGEVTNDYGADHCVFIFPYSQNPDANDCSKIEHHGCQRVVVDGVDNNNGFGNISISHGFYYNYEPAWDCNDVVLYLGCLSFNTSKGEVYMKLMHFDSDDDYIEYTLTRMQ